MVVIMISTLINIVFGIIETRLFLLRYGSEINGLLQTGNQVLGYLSLIESGIGAAFIYKMYKPLAEGDYRGLSSIYNGFKISMNSVVIKMLLVAGAVSLIYPLLLDDGLGYLYMVSVFVLISMKTIMPYLLTIVPKYMIIVKEQKYKAELISNACKSITYIAEILLLVFVTNLHLQVMLVICVIISALTGLCFRFTMKNLYGNSLDLDAKPDLSANIMSKDVLVHNLSRIVFNGTDNVVISILGSLREVTIYSNYNTIVHQASVLFQGIIEGAAASMGIKIARMDKNSYSVYRELMVGTCWSAAIITTVFVSVVNEFVGMCFGEQYCVSLLDRLLFGAILYSGSLFPCIAMARNACGLYKESKSFTIAQSVLNLSLTICLVPFWGITGALLGTVIARLTITIPMNYKLVEKKVFPQHKSKLYELPGGLLLTGLAILINLKVIDFLNIGEWVDIRLGAFVLNALISTLITVIIVSLYYLITDKSFIRLVKRVLDVIIGMIKRKA